MMRVPRSSLRRAWHRDNTAHRVLAEPKGAYERVPQPVRRAHSLQGLLAFIRQAAPDEGFTDDKGLTDEGFTGNAI